LKVDSHKPAVFQAPKTNDAAIRRELGRIDEMRTCVENAARVIPGEVVADTDSVVMAYLMQIQLLVE
jgi:hypothetical protein